MTRVRDEREAGRQREGQGGAAVQWQLGVEEGKG